MQCSRSTGRASAACVPARQALPQRELQAARLGSLRLTQDESRKSEHVMVCAAMSSLQPDPARVTRSKRDIQNPRHPFHDFSITPALCTPYVYLWDVKTKTVSHRGVVHCALVVTTHIYGSGRLRRGGGRESTPPWILASG